LNDASFVPFSNEHTSVFTIVLPESLTQNLISYMRKYHLQMSYESDYLKSKKWYQLATFGYYTEKQLKQVSKALSLFVNISSVQKIELF